MTIDDTTHNEDTNSSIDNGPENNISYSMPVLPQYDDTDTESKTQDNIEFFNSYDNLKPDNDQIYVRNDVPTSNPKPIQQQSYLITDNESLDSLNLDNEQNDVPINRSEPIQQKSSIKTENESSVKLPHSTDDIPPDDKSAQSILKKDDTSIQEYSAEDSSGESTFKDKENNFDSLLDEKPLPSVFLKEVSKITAPKQPRARLHGVRDHEFTPESIYDIPNNTFIQSGIALLINIERTKQNKYYKFSEVKKDKDAASDFKNLDETFRHLHFQVIQLINPTYAQLTEQIDKLSKIKFNRKDFFACVVMSANQNSFISTHDNISFDLNQLYAPLIQNETLRNKPKLFIVQSRRNSDFISESDNENYIRQNSACLEQKAGFSESQNVYKLYSVLYGSQPCTTTCRCDTTQNKSGSCVMNLLCDTLREEGREKNIVVNMNEIVEKLRENPTSHRSIVAVNDLYDLDYIFGP